MSHISSRSSASRSKGSTSHRSHRSQESTESAIRRAATRKVELQCRAEALRARLALECEQLKIEQQKQILDIETELKIEDAKLATLEMFDERKSSASSLLDLPEKRAEKEEVRQWLERYGTGSVQRGKRAVEFEEVKNIDYDIERSVGLPVPEVVSAGQGVKLELPSLELPPVSGEPMTLDDRPRPILVEKPNKDGLPLPEESNAGQEVKLELPSASSRPMTLDDRSRPILVEKPNKDGKEQAASSDVSQLTQLLIKQQVRASLPAQQIPIFSGDPLQFRTFMKAYEYAVEDKTTDSRDRLNYLCIYTSGEPKSLVTSCLYYDDPDQGYRQAKQVLTNRFGNKHEVAQAVLKKAKQWPDVKSEQARELNDFSLFMTECHNMMQANSALKELDNMTNLQMLVGKLPYRLKGLWRNKVYELQEEKMEVATFKDFVVFINKQARIASIPAFGTITKDTCNENKSNNRNVRNPARQNYSERRKAFATTTKESQPKETKNAKSTKPCTYCGGETKHAIIVCRKFAKLGYKEKSDFCFTKGLCFGCLETGHRKQYCTNPELAKCEKCHKSHPTVLHMDRSESAKSASGNENVKQAESNQPETKAKILTGKVNVQDPGHKTPLMTIVPVLVKHQKSDRCILTYAFLDNGCSSVFADPQLIDILNISTRKRNLLIGTLISEEVVESELVLGTLQVSGITSDNFIDLPRVYIQDGIPVSVVDMPSQHDLQKWSHLSNIELPELPSKYTHVPKVTLMIGSSVPAATMPLRTCCGDIGEPYAVYTPLGWAVYGIPGKFDDEDLVLAHFCTAHTVVRDSVEDLEQQFKSYIRMDFTENLCDDRRAKSQEDTQFLEMASRSVEFKDGHYHLNLPFRKENVVMPDNRQLAQSRAENLKRKFQKDQEYYAAYQAAMNKVIEAGYAEMVPAGEQVLDGKKWYVPHHGVIHPQKSKIRVVYDCAAEYHGTSLNKELIQGPDLTNTLIGVLLRFRLEPVAIISDIEGMFYQVKVKDNDSNFLRFLWWPDGDILQPLQEYRMLAHIFGANSSPAIANFALKQTAADNKDKFDSQVIDTINNNFYVDDCLKSTQTEESAAKLAQDLTTACDKGGFHLTKWVSNSKLVMNTIPEDERSETTKNLDLVEDMPSQKVLGMLWQIEKDQFSYQIDLKSKPLTRRGMLSTLCSLYDPLGFASPVILPAKQMLQEMCKQKRGWDDEVPDNIKRKWNKWTQSLPDLCQFTVDRCWKPVGFENLISVQMHHFADASQRGYGTASYLRLVNRDGQIECNLMISKSRVAPIKQVSIPKMELTAAMVAVKVNTMLQRELKVQPGETIFWTDSETVLKYINNETTRYPVFVANRISVIRHGSHPSQWKYVPTEVNPADHASRGLTTDRLIAKTEWLKGPDFLNRAVDDWSEFHHDGELHDQNLRNTELGEDDLSTTNQAVTSDQPDGECPATVNVNAVVVDQVDENTHDVQVSDPVSKLLEHYSEWNHLRRAVAWLLRWRQILLQRSKKVNQEINRGPLTVEELDNAESVLIKKVQRQCFPQEYKLLQEMQKSGCTRNLKKGSSLVSLDPVLKNDKICVGGRLRNAAIPEQAKHQIILPKNHPISILIIRHTHQKLGHQGRSHVLAEIRRKYWIINAGASIKKEVKRCVICRRVHATASTQKMSDLPSSRLQADKPPFTHTGLDYFGPFYIKQGRTTRKRYGVIFTCMASRAVHIEVAGSMDTDACINAIRRFVARRGPVKQMTSDNGSNLVGASEELRRAFKDLDQEILQRFSTDHGIEWKFNPPASSHQGGIWERQIRTIRKILNSLLLEQHLKTCRSEEELQTFFCEVESVINSRPLTKVNDDPADMNVITPNDLLLLTPSQSLPPGCFNERDTYARRRWRQVQYLADVFWKRWSREYLPALQERQKWLQPTRNLQKGDIVLVVDDRAPRSSWLMGRVEDVHVGNQGLVRSASIKTQTTLLTRPVTKLCLLLEQDS